MIDRANSRPGDGSGKFHELLCWIVMLVQKIILERICKQFSLIKAKREIERIDALKDVSFIKAVKTLHRHLPNILTNFKLYISNATAEGLNAKIQMVKQMACGFRNRDHYRMAITFHCGGLDLYPR